MHYSTPAWQFGALATVTRCGVASTIEPMAGPRLCRI